MLHLNNRIDNDYNPAFKRRLGLISANMYPQATGGMEIFNYFLLLALKNKYQIILYTASHVFLSSEIKVRVHSPRLLGISGFRAGQLWFMLKVAVDIVTTRLKPHFLHVSFTSNSSYYGMVLPFISSYLGIPYLVSVHGGGLKPWRPNWMYKRLFMNSSEVVAVSDVVQKEYEKRTGRILTLILPLIPFDPLLESKAEIRARLGYDQSALVILFLGSIKEIKRPLDILESLSILGREYLESQQILALFVGEGDQQAELESRANEAGLQNHIRLMGKVPYAETGQYYGLADLYIIPSRYEGTSKSMLGAMYYGLPIIGSDVPGINNVLKNEESGLLFRFGDADNLAQMLQRLVESEKLRATLAAEAARTYAAGYSFGKTVEEFSALYARLATRH